MEQAVELRPASRFNPRMIVFALLALVFVGMPAYWYFDELISGGIKDHGDFVEVNLQAMSSFPFDQSTGAIGDVPQKWRELDGRKVLLRGEMWAPNSAAPRLNRFELVYSIAKCCFSGPPQVQHFVQAQVKDGKAVPYVSGLVDVYGTLKVDVTRRPDGSPAAVYHLEVERLEPV